MEKSLEDQIFDLLSTTTYPECNLIFRNMEARLLDRPLIPQEIEEMADLESRCVVGPRNPWYRRWFIRARLRLLQLREGWI